MRADQPQIWLRISSFGRPRPSQWGRRRPSEPPVGFELCVEDNTHALTLADAGRLTDMGAWLTARAVDPERVPTLIESVGTLQAIATALDERASRERLSAPAVAERAGHGSGIGRPPDRRLEPDIALAAVSFGGRAKTGQMSTDEFLDAASRLGFGAVELCDRTIGDPEAVAEALSDRNLRAPSIALRNDFTGDPESVSASVAHLREWLAVAGRLGCRIARIWTGWQRDDASSRRQIIEAFDQVVDHAGGVGVGLAVETHGGASNDPRFLHDLAQRYAGLDFGVCLDFGNLPAGCRRDVIAAVAGITSHVHVKSYEFDADGVETSVPIDWAVGVLDAAGFMVCWVIEYEGSPPWIDGIVNTTAALRRGLGRS